MKWSMDAAAAAADQIQSKERGNMLETLASSVIVGGSILGAAVLVRQSINRQTLNLSYVIAKGSLIANFARFGQLDETSIAVIDEHAYFVQNGTLWIADFKNDDLLMPTARPIDLVNTDGPLLKEAMMAVDVLADINSGDADEDDE